MSELATAAGGGAAGAAEVTTVVNAVGEGGGKDSLLFKVPLLMFHILHSFTHCGRFVLNEDSKYFRVFSLETLWCTWKWTSLNRRKFVLVKLNWKILTIFLTLKASQYGHRDVVAFLLDSGADGHVQNPVTKYSPLYIAAYHGHKDVVQILLGKYLILFKFKVSNILIPVLLCHSSKHTLLICTVYNNN